MKESVYPPKEQVDYADLLFYGCWAGLAIMLLTYLVYITGIASPHVPLDELPAYWGRPVTHYLASAAVPTGWGWTALLGRGDFLNFLGIVLLAGLSIICYLRIIPALFRKGDAFMGIIAVAEVLVLLLAASGLVGAGAH